MTRFVACLSIVCMSWFGAAAQLCADESFTSVVKQIDRLGTPIWGGTPDVIAGVRVEGFYVHLTKQTIIVFEDARRAGLADLRVGQRISFRLASDIGSTNPPQVQTDILVIRSAPPASK